MNISASKVKLYKACKRAYFFRYIEGLGPVETAQPLKDGSDYHAALEDLYNTGSYYIDCEENPKLAAMLMAYEKYIYPQFKVNKAEAWFNVPLYESALEKYQLEGRFDGIADDGCVVEHKTTSSDIDDEYLYNLQWDEQILTYMLVSGRNEMYYTVCKKPTIRQKQSESAADYYQRCVDWYAEDTDKKIRVIKVTRSKKEIENYKKELVFLANKMKEDEMDEEEATFYRNCSHCKAFGRKCEYASICLDYDPKLEYVEFRHKEKTQDDEP